MSLTAPPSILGLLTALTLSAPFSFSPLQGQMPPEPPRDPAKLPPPFGDLSSEEREQIRNVLAEAWDDPEVTAARDAVYESTEHYRNTLRETVERIDPSAVALMNRMHEASKAHAMRSNPGFRGPKPPWLDLPRRLPREPEEAVRLLLEMEPAFRSLNTEDDRTRFLGAAREAGKTGELQAALRAYQENADDSPPGRDGSKSRRDLREAFVGALKRQDPWVRDRIEESEDRFSREASKRPPGSPDTVKDREPPSR